MIGWNVLLDGLSTWAEAKFLDRAFKFVAELARASCDYAPKQGGYDAKGFSIGVLRLSNDRDREVERALVDQIRTFKWTKLYRLPDCVSISDDGSYEENLTNSNLIARSIREKHSFSLLLWGEVLSLHGQKRLNLRVVCEPHDQFPDINEEISSSVVGFSNFTGRRFGATLRLHLLRHIALIGGLARQGGLTVIANESISHAKAALNETNHDWPLIEKAELGRGLIRANP